jgi:hypothetical protein
MHKSLSGLLAGVALLIAAPSTLAAPVTVDLRVEGPTRTLFEGPVTTDVRTFRFTGDAVAHRCDGTAENHGTSPTPMPTRGAAMATAAEQAPFAIHGEWSDSLGSPSFTDIDGEAVGFDGTRFLAEYKNAQAAMIGSCGDPIGPGDDVLFAYSDGVDPLLALAGPVSAKPGETATVRVTDAASDAAIAGAAVGGRTTAADGTATIGPFTQRGEHDLKASKPGTVRSNRLRVCVSDGHDGACATTTPAPNAPPPSSAARDTSAPVATIAGLRNGAIYSRRRAPRLLRGKVSADASGLHSVKLKLTRRVGRRCSYFSGRRERFVPMRCGRGSFLRIGDRADWSYLLPRRLGRGRYVLEVKAIDGAFNRGTPARVRFRVR